MANSDNKMMINVLCLHGCNQTQEMFKRLMKNYIRLGKQYNLNFYFTEAKYEHPIGGKTWYKTPLNVEDIGHIKHDFDLTNDTLVDIENLIHDNHIDILLGFSQGGNVVDTYLAVKKNTMIKRAVIMSGYSLLNPPLPLSPSNNIPILNVISQNDTVVPFNLAPKTHDEIYTLEHDKGHKLPTKNSQIRKICIFMQNGSYQN